MKTFRDVYKFPLEFQYERDFSRVCDSNLNFVFQFTFFNNEPLANLILDVINGKKVFENKNLNFTYKNGYISEDEQGSIILIRGWGNLTGSGAMNLSVKEAENIQDTFAHYIVEQLNKK